ncbi:copia protein [Tanacetum coccineum]|uniref:Copia protein n=1 Tax=Tanacetum coccineum TaxID=301880 RepID=A0ABQ4WMZ3_9ASTR
MSIIGELMFFLGLQIHQSPCGIFISQSKYTLELLKKHGMDGCDSISTPMATARLDADLQGTPTNQMKYHSMIRGLMYLTASRPDIDSSTFIHQSPCGIFISQSKYTLELLKKHGMDGCDSISAPMATARLDADLQGTPTDQMKYHSMIGGIMYLTASRPDIGT